jgi:hypothetical protein
VSQTDGHGEQTGPAQRLHLRRGQVVQELGWDDDADEELRTAIEAVLGTALEDEDYDDVVDAILIWFRADDGDLVDVLLEAVPNLADGGAIWLLTPKVGRDGYVDPSEISDAAPTAGMTTTTSLSAARDWSATKLVAPKTVRNGRR